VSFIGNWMTKKRFERLYEGEQVRLGLSVTGKDWLCPYCVQVVFGGDFAALGEEERREKIFAHVMECSRAKGMEGEMLPLLELRDVVEFRQLLARYQAEPALRIFGPGKRWVCPYCRESTTLTPVDASGNKLSRDRIVRGIQKHLRSCYKFAEDPGKFASVDEIKAMFQADAKREKFGEYAERVMQTNPVFQLKDSEGRWVCPFCERSVRFVDMSTDLLARLSAPKMATNHFVNEGCKGYALNLKTDKTVADMQALVQRINDAMPKVTPRSKRGKAEEDDAYLRDLKAEVFALKEEMKVSDELERSLARAREVQAKMLPDAPPEVPGYDFAAFYLACDRVGGDFYDFIDLGDGRMGFVMGDVSGHGLEAALVMGMTKKAFSLRAQETDSPAEVMRRVNGDVFGDLEEGTFITAFYAIVDPAAGDIVFARAGHNLPLLYDPSLQAVEEIRSPGIMLGADSGKRFDGIIADEERALGGGAFFLQYTDGITEAMNADLDEFGVGRLAAALEKHKDLSSEEAIKAIVATMQAFSGGQPQEDDICLVAIKNTVIPALI